MTFIFRTQYDLKAIQTLKVIRQSQACLFSSPFCHLAVFSYNTKDIETFYCGYWSELWNLIEKTQESHQENTVTNSFD